MADFDVDVELIRKLADLLTETGLSEIELAVGDRRVKVSRSMSGVAQSAVAWQAAAGEAGASGGRPGGAEGPHPNAVTAPMVGTVFVAAEPGATPFVKAGDRVAEGDTLLLIEAMKTYNPVKAPQAGTITRILVRDGSPVEYGEELMILEP